MPRDPAHHHARGLGTEEPVMKTVNWLNFTLILHWLKLKISMINCLCQYCNEAGSFSSRELGKYIQLFLWPQTWFTCCYDAQLQLNCFYVIICFCDCLFSCVLAQWNV